MTAGLYSAIPILAVAVLLAPEADEPTGAPDHAPESTACAAAAPIRIEMTPTRRAGGARAVYEMRFSSSTFGVAVSEAGHYMYDVEVSVTGLPERAGAVFVVWAATFHRLRDRREVCRRRLLEPGVLFLGPLSQLPHAHHDGSRPVLLGALSGRT
jgi:hypothetical protein